MSAVTIRQKESVKKVRQELEAEDNIEWRELDNPSRGQVETTKLTPSKAFILRQFESHKFQRSIDKISLERRQSAWNAVLQNLKDNPDLNKYHTKASELNGLMNWWLAKFLKSSTTDDLRSASIVHQLTPWDIGLKTEQVSGAGERVSREAGRATAETEIGRSAVSGGGGDPKRDPVEEALGGEDTTAVGGKGTRSSRNWWGTVL